MSIYDSETNFYADLNHTAPQAEPQTYLQSKCSETEAFFLDEIEKFLTGGISIAIALIALLIALASGVELPVGIVLGGASQLFFPYSTCHTRKYLKAFIVT